MSLRYLALILSFISCSKAQEKSNFISFKLHNDSIYVIAKNPALGKTFLKIIERETKIEKFIDFIKPDTLNVLHFKQSEIDTSKIAEKYQFLLYYGTSVFKKYDTLYNYGLPFLKGKRYKILQGQNTNFTHKGDFSRYAIDFKMKTGQKICAIREGLVVKVKEHFSKGGKNKKYRDLANLIIIAHKDGTFAQYVHLKKDGALVNEGAFVTKGQVIGYSGNTGMSTEPHLHFAIYKPTKNGLVSIPYILNSIPSKKYKKGKFAKN